MRRLILLVVLCSACGDLGPLGSVHPVIPPGALTDKNIPPDTAGDSPTYPADPEPQWPIRIHSTNIVGGLPYSYPGDIKVAGFMTYDAHHAEIKLNLNVTGPDAISRALGPVTKHSWTFFGNAHSAAFTHYIRSPCGNAAFLDFTFRAWWIGPAGWVLDERIVPKGIRGVQESCPIPGGGADPPGTGPGGGVQRCYTLVTHHYEYDPNTGETRYLYTTEEDLGCEYVS